MPLYVVIILVALTRLLPHPPNFASIGALALFAGYSMRSSKGFLVPLGALLLSDVVGHVMRVPGMGFYSPMMMLAVYGAFAAVVGVGRLTRSASGSRRSLLNVGVIAGGSVAGATTFFLISNFGVFLGGGYGMTPSGLLACYVAALPFFLNTLAGDLFFAFVLFGSAALVGKLDTIGATRRDLSGHVNLAD